jgi:hypothetical protein
MIDFAVCGRIDLVGESTLMYIPSGGFFQRDATTYERTGFVRAKKAPRSRNGV